MRPLAPPVLYRALLLPLQRFLRAEAASGVVLFVAATVALLLANSGFAPLYFRALHAAVGPVSLHAFVNEGLMTLFFLVVGLEIKHELVEGALSSLRSALLPAIAAVGGMLAPAAVYTGLTRGGPAEAGWAIPMATDIAFAVGCVALLGKRVPAPLVVFLTALAIFDDIGGIAVIALFYGAGIDPLWLGVAAAVAACIWLLARRGTGGLVPLLAGAPLLWFAFHHAGVHATLSGVLLGLLVPARSVGGRPAPLFALLEPLHRPVAFGVVPLFALANSGVVLQGLSFASLLRPAALGIILGLFAGKQLGIFAATLLAVRAGVAPLPGGAARLQLYGVSMVAGVGFTVALFIADLAFGGQPALLADAKLGILAGSLLSGVSGTLLLRAASPAPGDAAPAT